MPYDNYRLRVVIVAGEKPEKLMEKYDGRVKVKSYIVYKLKDAGKIKGTFEKYYLELLKSDKFSQSDKESINNTIENLRNSSDEVFFKNLTIGYDYDKHGNAISSVNKEAKFSGYALGQLFSVPFVTLDGVERFQDKKGNIDWARMHMHDVDKYAAVWDMVMCGKNPETEDEKVMYDNMKNRTGYLKKFETKENYVASCTSFWGYAFLSEETGWVELEYGMDQFTWMKNYYDMFISQLPDDELLTIYEYRTIEDA